MTKTQFAINLAVMPFVLLLIPIFAFVFLIQELWRASHD